MPSVSKLICNLLHSKQIHIITCLLALSGTSQTMPWHLLLFSFPCINDFHSIDTDLLLLSFSLLFLLLYLFLVAVVGSSICVPVLVDPVAAF